MAQVEITNTGAANRVTPAAGRTALTFDADQSPILPCYVLSSGTTMWVQEAASPMNGLLASSVADSAALNTAETVLAVSGAFPSGAMTVGQVFEFVTNGTCTSTVANASTFTIRIGTTGTTSDTAVATFTTATAAASGTTIPFSARAYLTIRTTGAAATVQGRLAVDNAGATGIATVLTQVLTPTTATFTTLAANKISITYKSAATTTTSTFQQSYINAFC